MLSRVFRVKEKVQVLDAVLSIWVSSVILSIISDWCVKIKWSDWSGSAIFSDPEDRKESAAALNIGNFHECIDTCVISRRPSSKKRSYCSKSNGCTGTRWSFSNMLGVSRKGWSSSTTLSCPNAQFVRSTNLRILREMDHHAVEVYTLGTPS